MIIGWCHQYVDGCNAGDTGKLSTWAREEGYFAAREAQARAVLTEVKDQR